MTGTLKTGTLLLLLGLPLFAQTSKESHPTEAQTSMGSVDPVPTDTGSGLEILTDTQGVDFGPYLAQMLHIVKQNWYSVIPESARSPQLKRGKVVIEFAITKNGQVAGMRYVSSSGDVTLDRAAYGGITASSPFPPLPSKFDGPFVGLRMSFRYNPGLNGISPPRITVPAGSSLPFVPILQAGTDATQFRLTWSVVGKGCRGDACGTISETGMYTAPPKVPDDPIVTVQAKAESDSSQTVSAIVTILPPDRSR